MNTPWTVTVDESAEPFFYSVGSTTYAYYKMIYTEILPFFELNENAYESYLMDNGEVHRALFISAPHSSAISTLFDWLNEPEVDIWNALRRSALFVWETPKVRYVLGGISPNWKRYKHDATVDAIAVVGQNLGTRPLHKII